MEQQRLFFNKWLYRRLPYFLRRRLTPQQAPFVLVVILAAFVIVCQLLIMFNNNDEIEALEQKLKTLKISKPQHHRRPLAQIIGIDPKLRRFYVPTDKNKFVCLDSNQEIPFDWVNDDFCDCPNGSDEPATGACQKNPFYCTTQSKSSPTWIPSGRVNDGICDCCDGSDEWAGNQPLLKTLDQERQEKLHKFQAPCHDRCDSN